MSPIMAAPAGGVVCVPATGIIPFPPQVTPDDVPPSVPDNVPDTADAFDYEAALRACSRGDRQALHRIYEREGRLMLGVALRIVRQRQLAEDVVHDAFMSIWTGAGSFDAARGSGRGWIYSVVRNKALNAVRDGAREVSADEEAIEAIGTGDVTNTQPDMGDAFQLRADIGRLNDCLARLDTPKRNSILYAYLEGCSHSEIAARLNSPLGTVKAWIRRGLAALRECLA